MKTFLALLASLFATGALAQPITPPSPWSIGPSLSLFYNNGGATMGSPTGGTQGIGTINVSGGYYVNGAPIGLTVGSPISGTCPNGQVLFSNSGNLGCEASAGSGTVTSVAMTVPTWLAVSGSPVTAAGTLAVTSAPSVTQNQVLASPNGAPGVLTTRALVNADLPSIPATDLTGQVSVPNGGTGAATLSTGLPLIGQGTSAITTGAKSGSTAVFGTTSGTLTNGHCVQFDASGNLVDAGGTCTVGGGGGTVGAGTINQLAWYSATGTSVVGLATANNGTLVTSAGGVPSISSTLPSAVQANIIGTGTLASGTTASGFTVACASEPAKTGDVTASSGSCAQTVAANAVTYSKFQQVAASSLVGNTTGVLANATGITLGATLAFSGTALQTAALTGDVTAAANSFATTVSKIQGTSVSGTSGTGNVLFSAGPTITGSLTATGLVTNADLVNPATTVNGQVCTLGAACTITNAAIIVASTPVNSGPANGLLYDNAGTLGGVTSANLGILVTNGSGVPSISSLLPWQGASTPTNSGTCAINTQLGNNTVGSFKANGTCTNGTVILTLSYTATNGWICAANDMTTGGTTLRQTAYTATTATFAATMTNLDLVGYRCDPF